MIKNNDKISANQASILLFVTIVGAGVLSLPADVAKDVGPDSLFAILLGGTVSILFARLILYISSKFPTETFVEYTSKLVTKPVSVILSIGLVLYFSVFVSLDLRIFGEVLKIYLLPRTPIEVIMLTMLFTSAYLVRYGLEPIARMSEILFPIIVIPLILIFLPTLTDVDLSNFLPVLRTAPLKLLKGIVLTAYSFIGFEILYMLFPYIENTKKLGRNVNAAMFSTILYYIYITFFTIGIFGYKETKEQLWPLLTVIKSINFPGFFIENLEGFVMAIWTFTIFTSVYSFYYAASLTMGKLIKAREHSYLVMPLIPFMFLMSLIPSSIVDVYKYSGYVSQYMTLFFAVLLPVMLFLAIKIKKEGAQ